jgi:serine beta-lactamase-like protein LACTB
VFRLKAKSKNKLPLISPKIPAAKIEKIETAIAAWMAQNKAPALSVAIVTDNQMSFSKGYGLADVENNVAARSDTAYRLASIAKSMTAIAVMQLVERGKIDLNAPINKYCAAYPRKASLKRRAGQAILNHRAAASRSSIGRAPQ